MGRRDVVTAVARRLMSVEVDHPTRVGIDGICGAGKSTFARELVETIRDLGRPAIHLDSDGFHHVRERRRRQSDQARGYYDDAYDLTSLAELALRPLGPGGSRRYATAVHDLHSDEVITDASAVAEPDAILVFAATFVQRPELDGLWDHVVYLHADESAATERGVARDAADLGGEDAARAAYAGRYLAACRIYLAERDPREHADVVVDTTDPTRPVIER